MAAKSVIKFVLGQFAKRSARNTGIPKILNANDSIVQSNALSIENSMSCRKTQKELVSATTSEKSIMGKFCFTNVIIFLYSA